jgi:hypothetical protein
MTTTSVESKTTSLSLHERVQEALLLKRQQAEQVAELKARQDAIAPFWFSKHLDASVDDVTLHHLWPVGVQVLFYQLHNEYKTFATLDSIVDRVLDSMGDGVPETLTLADFMRLNVDSYRGRSTAIPECSAIVQTASRSAIVSAGASESKVEIKEPSAVECVKVETKQTAAAITASKIHTAAYSDVPDLSALSLQELEAIDAKLTKAKTIKASVRARLITALEMYMARDEPSFVLWSLAARRIKVTFGEVIDMAWKVPSYHFGYGKEPTLAQRLRMPAIDLLLQHSALLYLKPREILHDSFGRHYGKRCTWNGEFGADKSTCTCDGKDGVAPKKLTVTLRSRVTRYHNFEQRQCNNSMSLLSKRHYATLVRPLLDLAQFWCISFAGEWGTVSYQSDEHHGGDRDAFGVFGVYGVGVGLLPTYLSKDWSSWHFDGEHFMEAFNLTDTNAKHERRHWRQQYDMEWSFLERGTATTSRTEALGHSDEEESDDRD